MDNTGPSGLTIDSKIISSFAFLWGCASFLPYPALSIGKSTGLQIGNIIVIGCLLFLFPRIPKRHLTLWFTFQIVSAASLLAALMRPDVYDVALSLKSFLVMAFFSASLLSTAIFLSRHLQAIILGIAVSVIFHSILGFYQVYAFQQGYIPFEFIYNNPSFLSIHDGYGEEIVKYIKRPFGLFPEPSAMAACIGPWLVLFFAYALGLAKVSNPSRIFKPLLLISAVLGLIFIMASLTGMSLLIVISCLGVISIWIKQHVLPKSTPFWGFVVVASGLVFGYAVGLMTYLLMLDRVTNNVARGASWQDRYHSIMNSFGDVLSGNIIVLFSGIGIGQGAVYMQSTYGLNAVFSVILNNVVETGLLGFSVWIFILVQATKSVVSSGLVAVGMIFLACWFVGAALVTSYATLFPIWLSLAVLISWRDLQARCEPAI